MNHPANIPPPNWQEGRKPGRCPSMFPRLPLLYWHECDGTFRFVFLDRTGLTRSISSASTTTGVVVSCVILLLDSNCWLVLLVFLGSGLFFPPRSVVLRYGVEASCRVPVLALYCSVFKDLSKFVDITHFVDRYILVT